MKAVRSSGRGGDSQSDKNGVPVSCPGVQTRAVIFRVESVGVRNRQDYFKMEQYRGFRIVRMEWTGFRHRENGRLPGASQQQEVLSFLTGIMMVLVTMWESWKAVMERQSIR